MKPEAGGLISWKEGPGQLSHSSIKFSLTTQLAHLLGQPFSIVSWHQYPLGGLLTHSLLAPPSELLIQWVWGGPDHWHFS